MKIQYCSDLHLEFKQNSEYIKANPLEPVGEILLLAGDIVPFSAMDKHASFLNIFQIILNILTGYPEIMNTTILMPLKKRIDKRKDPKQCFFSEQYRNKAAGCKVYFLYSLV